MAVSDNKFTSAMRNLVEMKAPDSAEARDKLLDDFVLRMQGRIDAGLSDRPDVRSNALALLTAARAEIDEFYGRALRSEAMAQLEPEATDASQSNATTMSKSGAQTRSATYLALLIAGVLLGGAGTFLGLQMVGSSAGGRLLISSEDAGKLRSAALEIRAFVDRLETELADEQWALAVPDNDRFVPVASLWPEDYALLSPEARHALGIIVRKFGDTYKILINGPICTIAVADGIFDKDPRRSSPYGEICDFMAV